MPSVSKKEHNAMMAAAHGHSTLGIPKKVGQEFSKADKGKTFDQATLAPNAAIAAGALRQAKKPAAQDMKRADWTGLLRGLVKFLAEEAKEPEHAEDEKPGDDGVKPNDRSIFEYMPPPPNAAEEVKKQHAQCLTCRMLVPQAALPAEGKHRKGCDLCVIIGSQEAVDGRTDRGSCGEFANWPTPDATPDQGVVAEHAKKLAEGAPGSATKEQVGYVERAVRCENCFFGGGDKCKWFLELSEKTPEYFSDPADIEPQACCNSQTAKGEAMAGDSACVIAMDRDTIREKTRDGRLTIDKVNVTKANICPYRGEEIPGWEQLGLDPNAVYNLLRDPEELKKAAPTLNGVQLLKKHTPVSATDPHQDKTVGSLGTDAEWDGEYLTNSLFVNVQEAIDGIESGAQRELSAGYHYKPDMTPGIFNGKRYDGVMRDIVFNHVALVEDGRVGADCAA